MILEKMLFINEINRISGLNDFMTPDSWNDFTKKVSDFLLDLKTFLQIYILAIKFTL